VKIVFKNPDATDHNLVIVRPGALADVGMAANEMARDPRNANSDFIPASKKDMILDASPMIGPTRKNQVHVLRFNAPPEPGIYPFVCTFPGHWIIMKGDIVVADNLKNVEAMLAARKPTFVKDWKMSDFANLPKLRHDEETVMRGMAAFVKARCNQCHVVAGHGIPLGPDLTKISERFKGKKLLQQMLAPSTEINKKFQTWQFLMDDGKVHSGVISEEDDADYHVIKNLLVPTAVTKIAKKNVDERFASKVSPMPEGLLKVLTREEILDVVSFLEAGGYQPPGHLKHKHGEKKKKSCDCCREDLRK
jgi:putative heme-binding domain-containing protein